MAIVALAPLSVLSQFDPQRALQEIIQDYEGLRYAEGQAKARAALATYARFTPAQLVTLHTYLGFIEFALGQLDSAKSQFRAALSLEPKLSLDPVYTSPKIITLFEEVKRESHPRVPSERPVEIRYVLLEDKRSGAALRSLLLPGWGQLYKGEKTKGLILLSLAGAALGSLIATHIAQAQAHNDYRAAKAPADIESKYDRYNRLYKARNALAVFTGALWLYAYIDAALVKVPLPTPTGSSLLFPELQADRKTLRLVWQF